MNYPNRKGRRIAMTSIRVYNDDISIDGIMTDGSSQSIFSDVVIGIESRNRIFDAINSGILIGKRPAEAQILINTVSENYIETKKGKL